ncbi:MAG: hypothetical protein P8R42_21290 [Candidatus Binatia bacterium]|nr:hypothetical protein [Candidatus Binatia bacterium]
MEYWGEMFRSDFCEQRGAGSCTKPEADDLLGSWPASRAVVVEGLHAEAYTGLGSGRSELNLRLEDRGAGRQPVSAGGGRVW